MTMQGVRQDGARGWLRGDRQGISGQRSRPAGRGEERLARALGWASLGLGLPGVATPGALGRLIGLGDDRDNQVLLRLVGLREVASGIGLLVQPRPVGWLWLRLAGDAMDLALLGAA